ncbi:collagen-binding domain-containing protein, partial [Polaribacter sp. M15]
MKTFSFLNIVKGLLLQLSKNRILPFILISFFGYSVLYAQTTLNYDSKQSIRQSSGIMSKSKTKTSVEDFSVINSYSSASQSNICSPETSVLITEGSSYGISRSTINNSGVPSFCLSLGDAAPDAGDVYNTTLNPANDISFNNPNLSASTIRDRVQRTMSIIEHPNYAPNSLPNLLTSNFYKAIQIVVWGWTNNLNVSDYNYSWTGKNGNTYYATNLKNWVLNGSLQKSNVFWLIPEDGSLQPEILLNQNTSSNCCASSPSITTSVNTPTYGNNGEIIIDANNRGKFYGISSANAVNYNGPTTIATAIEIPSSLPTTILNNALSNGATYIVRVFTNIDGCFTDYTITTPDSGQSCQSFYAEFQSETNNVTNERNAEGAPDGNYAEIYSSDEQLILDFGQVFSAGTVYNITWRVRNSQSGLAYIDLSESTSANSGFTNHPNSPQTSSNSFINTRVTANSNFRYLAFDKGNINHTDYDLDAVEVIVCVTCDVADNTTTTASITESETKTLSGSPAGGTWSIVSGGGVINGTTYTPDDVNANTNVTLRYTIAADGSCTETTDDVTFTVTSLNCDRTSPTAPALDFNVFTLNSLSLQTNETEGSVATGGDLTLLGNYQVATNDAGTFQVNNTPIGLLVGGKINYQSGNSLQVNQNSYVKIGNNQGSTVWYKDQNNAYSNIRITPSSNYNSSPRIQLQTNANNLNVSEANNPVFESNLIDFVTAFQTLETNATTLSQNANNAQLTNPNGQSISNTSLPNQVKINLQGGVNYLNVTGTDLNNVDVFTYNTAPSATKILVVNVNAPGTFNWDVWNQSGVGQQNAPYVIYNFYNTTTLNIVGSSTIVGSVLAPFANINKTVNQSNLEGQVIGLSFNHAGGEVHSANFSPALINCTEASCDVADNTTATASITENETKTLTGSPVGGTWSIFSGGGSISGNTYTPADINTNTTVKIKYTIPADGSCAETSDIVTFSVTPVCDVVADNTTSTASITEDETKTLSGSPAGGTWSIVSGGGSISGSTYTPDDINTDTTVVIRYTIAADGDCAATTDDVTFTVTPVCDVVADNTTSSATISELDTKTLTGAPAGGTWSIVSGGGSISGNTYTPDDIISNETVKIRYTIAADGDCAATTDDVTFTVEALPTATATKTDATCYGLDDGTITITFEDNTSRTNIVFSLDGGNTYQAKLGDNEGSVTYSNLAPGTYDVWAKWGDNDYPIDLGADLTISEPAEITINNTTSGASITENQTKTLTASPAGGTWSIVSGGGSIAGSTYTPNDINTDTTVVIRYTIAADGDCAATSDDVTFTVTPVCDVVADNTTSTASITEDETKTLSGSPAGGTWSIISGGGSISRSTYTPDDINTDTTVVIRYTIAADGDCAATSEDVTFTVTPVCDDPINSVTSNLTTTEDTQLNLNTTSVSGDDLISVRLRVSNGTLNVIIRVSGTRNDVTVNGPGDLLITGNERTINNYLRTLTYTPNSGFYGTDVLTIDSENSCGTIITNNYNITINQNCEVADNTTSTVSITEDETKTLSGTPAGGTWSIVSGSGSISGSTYTPDDINTDTTVVIRYTIAEDDTCAATSDDVTFTVTPVCDVVADNTTSTASITEDETKTLSGSPAGGTWSIISGGGSISGSTYTPDDINTETTVVIRYTIAADGDCAATTDDVTFTVTPVCDVVADNTTSTASITEDETKTLSGSPAG